jgi:hypothetical protein
LTLICAAHKTKLLTVGQGRMQARI